MKFFRIDLLTLLISLFILSSCKNQDSVGLNINSPVPLHSGLIDTSTIVINTVPEDSVVTSGPLPKNPLAYFTDPIFGTSISSIATDLHLPLETSYVPPTGTILIDSARLILSYEDGFYGDSITTSYTVDVFQLAENFNAGLAYYNTKKWNVGNMIGSLTFTARPHDSLKVYDIIAGAPDTLVKVPPQIRIPINSAFINTNLFAQSANTLSNDAIFSAAVKGLYISIDQAKTKGPGGVFMFSSADSLAVYYRTVSGTTIDTDVLRLPITHTASSIQHIYTSTITTELANQTTGSRNNFYIQGLAGLRAKINFPNLLYNFRKSLLNNVNAAKDSDILINRAELVITPTPGTYIPYSPLPKITMYQLDIALQRVEIQDAGADVRSGGVGVFGGFYNPNLNEYHFVITAYLQDLLWGSTVNYGTYIGAVDTTSHSSVDITATPQIAARTVAVGTNKASPYSIKLNIIYTKIAKR